ncbi:TetR/AcrR family transcriptional regulator [Tistrella mobilis]|jgi:AcrR family transcriptional regulator|uniref:TetR/AcrR family transcriptional regulator n=1 Tax=Tistrella mobilis TaxID=171437 RepID=UPI0035566C44
MARLVRERSDIIPILGEVFRAHGYEGASLQVIGAATGLGRGSLYNFFPGGKEEMAAAVLADIDRWFRDEIFRPLEVAAASAAPYLVRTAIHEMAAAAAGYFQGGRRICLVGAFALDGVRDRFAAAVAGYFRAWIEALGAALVTFGLSPTVARARAVAAVADIQGALVLARALDDPGVFDMRLKAVVTALTAGWNGVG